MWGLPIYPFGYPQMPYPNDFSPRRRTRRGQKGGDMRRSPLKEYMETAKEIEEFMDWKSSKEKLADEKKKEKEKKKPKTLSTLEAVLIVIVLYPWIGTIMEAITKIPK